MVQNGLLSMHDATYVFFCYLQSLEMAITSLHRRQSIKIGFSLLISKQFTQYTERLQFWEIWQMQTIVMKHDINKPVAVVA